ncbi:MAG: endonuclease/exonuclease/phosphatase family protein [Pirellulaceae bacterium]|nr:endonuclease/exonuclease/phosphatase family protein [Pirellulaceae bacterium]
MKTHRFVPLILGLLTLTNGQATIAEEKSLILDGRFDDWTDQQIIARDPIGDQTAAFDISYLAARTDGTRLYLRFDLGQTLNLQNGPESEGTLELRLGLPTDRFLAINFRERFAYYSDAPSERIPWQRIDFACLPTFASDSVEMRVDLSHAWVTTGESVTVDFRGSDQLSQPVLIRLEETSTPQPHSTNRLQATDFRVASLNTLRGGLSDARRSEPIGRLIGAADANIYCFQEENDESRFRQATRLVGRHQHWANGCGIVTNYPLKPLSLNLSQGAVASITLPGGKSIIVCSVHFKCCGYRNSPEDRHRVRQAERLTTALTKLRLAHNKTKTTSPGVIVIGDYNLVGSRRPLALLESIGLRPRLLLANGDNSATTWRGRPDEPFWPGRLDIVSYDAKQLRPTNGFLLDTGRMTNADCTQLGLKANDSQASDHLMLVADFQLREQLPSHNAPLHATDREDE